MTTAHSVNQAESVGKSPEAAAVGSGSKSAHTAGVFSGRHFRSAADAAIQFQYEARLCSANSRELKRFGPMHCAFMQREAAELYAAARAVGSAA